MAEGKMNTRAPSASPNQLNVNKLGVFLDGWAELIEGMGSKAEKVREDVLTLVSEKEMPDINTKRRSGYVSLVSKERRDYIVSTTKPGATTSIFIAQYGKDLYASWRTRIQLVLNWELLISVTIGVVIIAFFTGGIRQSGGFFGPQQTAFSISGWFFATIGLLLFAAVVIAIAGRVIKGDFLAYFFIEANIFDAEDITAMSLAAHYSVLRALDQSGIDTTKLRIKQKFTGGRRGEDV
jgi:hypothetical protein